MRRRQIKKNQPSSISADTSYGVYLFHWPSLSSSLNIWEIWWQPLDDDRFLDSNGSVLYGFEPTTAGKEPRVFGMKMQRVFDQADLLPHDSISSLWWSGSQFCHLWSWMRVIVSGLNQADSKMQYHTDAGQCDGNRLYRLKQDAIGDLRAQDTWLKPSRYPDDAVVSVSWKWNEGLETDISNKVLLKKCGHCPRTNTVSNYKELAGSVLKKIKGCRLILLWHHMMVAAPNDQSSESAQTSSYELN